MRVAVDFLTKERHCSKLRIIAAEVNVEISNAVRGASPPIL